MRAVLLPFVVPISLAKAILLPIIMVIIMVLLFTLFLAVGVSGCRAGLYSAALRRSPGRCACRTFGRPKYVSEGNRPPAS
jgi:hypothetical protein